MRTVTLDIKMSRIWDPMYDELNEYAHHVFVKMNDQH